MVEHIVPSKPVVNPYLHLRKSDNHLRAEIKISSDDLGYQFKLRQIDGDQGSFFVNKNSFVLSLLKAGSVLDMKYWTADKTRRVKSVKAEINNIAKQNYEPFKGHYKVSFSILKTKSFKLVNPLDDLLKRTLNVNDLKRPHHRHYSRSAF